MYDITKCPYCQNFNSLGGCSVSGCAFKPYQNYASGSTDSINARDYCTEYLPDTLMINGVEYRRV